MSHLTFTLLLALVIAAGVSDRFGGAASLFLRCAGALVAGSWVMFLIHG